MGKRILYICEGSGMAGVETYALTLMKGVCKWTDWELSCATFYDGIFRNELKRQNIKTVDLCETKNLKSMRKISRYVNDNKINIVHMIDLKSTIVGGVCTIRMKGVKKIVTIHGLPELQIGTRKYIKYGLSIAAYFFILHTLIDKVVYVSRDLSKKMEFILKKINSEVIHNGLYFDKNFMKPAENTRKRENFVIGSVGRLDVVKGYEFLLDAVVLLIEKHPNVVVEIVGDGPLKNELNAKAKRLGLQNRVKLLGFREDAKRLIGNMDIFVLPSLHEGIPYVLLEALALGKPVVCSAVGGILEVIENGESGILVPAKNAEKIADSISRLISNWEIAKKLGENGKRKIFSEFSAKNMVEKTANLYSDLWRSAKGLELCE